MGLIILKKERNTAIAIWEITESLNEITTHFQNQKIKKFNSKKRQLEFLCTRLLLQKINKDLEITYNKYGAPELNNNQFISISHTRKLIAIVISNKKVGVDIELISEKALKIKSKFLSENDMLELNQEESTLAWCAKESIYKWYQKSDINFKEDIKILNILKSPSNKIHIDFKNESVILDYLKINNHFLVYFCK
tara:strand:- start:120 stop:701 length:582 start_codon:yes stop_codon:yes gene_type:complete